MLFRDSFAVCEKNKISIIYKELFFFFIARLPKKVEVFLFLTVKHHLNIVLDRTVQRYFTVKNGENEHKK